MSYPDNRLDVIFQYIVESYIDTVEPVGSRTVSKLYGHLSPASIRNVMADLEAMGLIRQPHTSAGRIPTLDGYRRYVNMRLNDFEEPAGEEESDGQIEEILQETRDVEDRAENLSRYLADQTHQAAICFVKNVRRFSRLGDEDDDYGPKAFVSNDRVFVQGASHVFEQPEFTDTQRAYLLMRVLEKKQALAEVLEPRLGDARLHIYIGEDLHGEAMPEVSLVFKPYAYHGQPIGCVAVIGPARMHYERAVKAVSRVADSLTEFLKDE